MEEVGEATGAAHHQQCNVSGVELWPLFEVWSFGPARHRRCSTFWLTNLPCHHHHQWRIHYDFSFGRRPITRLTWTSVLDTPANVVLHLFFFFRIIKEEYFLLRRVKVFTGVAKPRMRRRKNTWEKDWSLLSQNILRPNCPHVIGVGAAISPSLLPLPSQPPPVFLLLIKYMIISLFPNWPRRRSSDSVESLVFGFGNFFSCCRTTNHVRILYSLESILGDRLSWVSATKAVST